MIQLQGFQTVIMIQTIFLPKNIDTHAAHQLAQQISVLLFQLSCASLALQNEKTNIYMINFIAVTDHFSWCQVCSNLLVCLTSRLVAAEYRKSRCCFQDISGQSVSLCNPFTAQYWYANKSIHKNSSWQNRYLSSKAFALYPVQLQEYMQALKYLEEKSRLGQVDTQFAGIDEKLPKNILKFGYFISSNKKINSIKPNPAFS